MIQNADKPDNGIRYRVTYRNSNLYINVFKDSIHLSMENSDQFFTQASLSLIEQLLNSALETDYTLEDLAGLAFTASLRNNDLPRLIHNAIMEYMECHNQLQEDPKKT